MKLSMPLSEKLGLKYPLVCAPMFIISNREMLLACAEPPSSTAHGRRVVKTAAENVAQYLGNTATICKNSYIHPIVVEAYFAGVLQDHMRACLAKATKSRPRYLEVSESAVVRLFERLTRARDIAGAA